MPKRRAASDLDVPRRCTGPELPSGAGLLSKLSYPHDLSSALDRSIVLIIAVFTRARLPRALGTSRARGSTKFWSTFQLVYGWAAMELTSTKGGYGPLVLQ